MAKPTCILALDAAGAACSAAVWSDGVVRAHRLEVMERGQSERLVPMIEEVVRDSGITYEQISAIAATIGPGGFTGVRIGLATARGLALACACPVIGLTTFEAAVAAVEPEERTGRSLVALIESKRNELYVQDFGAIDARPSKPLAVAPEQLDGALPPGPLRLVGDGAKRGAQALWGAGRDDALVSAAAGPIDAAVIARLAASRPPPRPSDPPPGPLYLRAPDVTPARGRLQP